MSELAYISSDDNLSPRINGVVLKRGSMKGGSAKIGEMQRLKIPLDETPTALKKLLEEYNLSEEVILELYSDSKIVFKIKARSHLNKIHLTFCLD